MYRKHLAALAAAAAVSSPCAAFDSLTPITPGVMFYLSIPLEAVKAKDQTFSAGSRSRAGATTRPSGSTRA